MYYDSAKKIADGIINDLSPYCEKISITGSIRRKVKECKDIDFILIPRGRDLFKLKDSMKVYKRIKGNISGRFMQCLHWGMHLDFFIVTADTWGLQMAIRSGPPEYSHHVLAMGWSKKGYHSEGGILYPTSKVYGEDRLDYSKPLYLREEIDVFNFIGLPWREPQDRL